MLRLEVLLRTSPFILEQMGERVDSGSDDWMPLIEPLVQKPIVHAFGFVTPEQEQRALMYLRSASQIWPEDPDFHNIPFWVRANRARDATFSVGDVAPQVTIHPLNDDGNYGPGEPLYDPTNLQYEILIAGSIT